RGVAQRAAAVRLDADQVALDHVAGGAAEEVDAGPAEGDAVAGNDVAGRGRGAADEVVRPALDEHAVGAVAQGGRAQGVGADQVALHRVARGTVAQQEDAVRETGGDDVARPGRGAADDAVAGALDDHAVAAVAQGGRAVEGGADVVAQDLVAGRAAADVVA